MKTVIDSIFYSRFYTYSWTGQKEGLSQRLVQGHSNICSLSFSPRALGHGAFGEVYEGTVVGLQEIPILFKWLSRSVPTNFVYNYNYQ